MTDLIDVQVENHGSLVILKPLTPAGEAWMDEHLPTDAQRWGNGVVVEPRYVDNIVAGMQADGLVLA